MARLRDAHAALDAQVRQLHAEREGLTMRVQELEAHLASVPAAPETVPDPETEAELARLREAYRQLEAELEAARAAAAQPDPQLQAEIDRLQAEGVELRTALAEAGRSGRSAEAAAELQAATVQRDALEARLAEVGDSLAAKERELATQSESIAALEAETAASRETNEAELVRVENELQEVRALLAEREAELADARRAAEAAVVAEPAGPEPAAGARQAARRGGPRREPARARRDENRQYYRATLGQRDDELAEASVDHQRAGERTAALQTELQNLQSRLHRYRAASRRGDARPRPYRGRGAARPHGGGPRRWAIRQPPRLRILL